MSDWIDCEKHGRVYLRQDGCLGCLRACVRYVVAYCLPDGEVRDAFEAVLRGDLHQTDWIDEDDLTRGPTPRSAPATP